MIQNDIIIKLITKTYNTMLLFYIINNIYHMPTICLLQAEEAY